MADDTLGAERLIPIGRSGDAGRVHLLASRWKIGKALGPRYAVLVTLEEWSRLTRLRQEILTYVRLHMACTLREVTDGVEGLAEDIAAEVVRMIDCRELIDLGQGGDRVLFAAPSPAEGEL